MTGRPGFGPPCAAVGVVGLGLIGGSIALRVRATWPEVRVVGVDRRRVIQEAVRAGVIHDYRTSLAELTDCDLVVLAVPVPSILELIEEAGVERLPVVVTDVGSTKRVIMGAAARGRRELRRRPSDGGRRACRDRAREGRPV